MQKKNIEGWGSGGDTTQKKIYTGRGGHHTYFVNRGTNNLEKVGLSRAILEFSFE